MKNHYIVRGPYLTIPSNSFSNALFSELLSSCFELNNPSLLRNSKFSYKKESGNIALYVMFILPLVMGLLIIVIDISSWQFLREEAQREADRIVLQVAQQLPYTDLAQASLAQVVSQFNQSSFLRGSTLRIDPASVPSSVLPSRVRLRVDGVQNSLIDGFFSLFNAGQLVSFSVSEEASARLVPVDAVLIFSDAVTLRPQVPIGLAEIPLSSASWGDPLSWPPSEYFSFIPPPRIIPQPNPVAPLAWPRWWLSDQFNNPEYRRWATQLCFNPALSPLKFASMMVVDAISVSSENRVLVLASPGDFPSSAESPGFSVIGDRSFTDESSRWSNYTEPSIGNSDEACVFYADTANLGSTSRYAIPLHPTASISTSECGAIIETIPFGDSRGHYPNPLESKLSECFRSEGGPRLRESIYYRSVRANVHDLDAQNIARSIRAGFTSLLEQDWEGVNINPDAGSRGGLLGSNSKIIIVLSDALPLATNSLMEEIISYLEENEGIRLYLLGYRHQGLNASLTSVLDQALSSYANIPGVDTFSVNETDIQPYVQGILLNERKVVLSS